MTRPTTSVAVQGARSPSSSSSSREPSKPHAPIRVSLLLSVIPVLIVLLGLPIMEEMEIARNAAVGGRGTVRDRLALLESHPDWIIRASSHNVHLPGSSLKTTYSYNFNSKSNPVRTCKVFKPTRAQSLDSDEHTTSGRRARPRITHVRIVGERHCGTQYLKSELTKNVRNATVSSGFTRWKYWFQEERLLSAKARKRLPSTLVVHVSCDPYQWIARMQANPIFAPYHRQLQTEFKFGTFLRRKWTLPKPAWEDASLRECQYDFAPGRVFPCVPGKYTKDDASKMYPVYELEPEPAKPGIVFENIVSFRGAKMANFLNMSSWAPHVIHVKQEDVMTLSGTNALLAELAERYSLEICESNRAKAPQLHVHATPPQEDLTFMTCALDWKVEKMLGYTRLKSFQDGSPVECPENGRALGTTERLDERRRARRRRLARSKRRTEPRD